MKPTRTKLNEFALDMPDEHISEPTVSSEIDDHEGAMIKADLYKLAKYAVKLFKKIQDDDQFESWVQAKIVKASDYISSVYHYIEYEMEFNEYGKKLENSDIYNESIHEELKNKLMEAKEKIKTLKKMQADKVKAHSPKKEKEKDKETTDDELNEKAVNPYAVGMAAAKKEAGIKKKKATDLPKKVITKGHKIAKKIKATNEEIDETASKPSAGLTKKQKSSTVKAAKSGKDIGKPGKKFKDVAKKAEKQYGSKEKGEKVAAAAMWKAKAKSVKESYNPEFDDSELPEDWDIYDDMFEISDEENDVISAPQPSNWPSDEENDVISAPPMPPMSDEENDVISAPPASDEENDVMSAPTRLRESVDLSRIRTLSGI